MPEVLLDLEWPDGHRTRFYSPSTVVLQHLPPGSELSVAELREAGLRALVEASERVRARYGFACTRTDEEAASLQRLTAGYDDQARVRVRQVQG
ncbi:MAG: MSMEG_0570 family nitrogen starvation response protein [Cyanobium sp.]